MKVTNSTIAPTTSSSTPEFEENHDHAIDFLVTLLVIIILLGVLLCSHNLTNGFRCFRRNKERGENTGNEEDGRGGRGRDRSGGSTWRCVTGEENTSESLELYKFEWSSPWSCASGRR